MATLLTQLSDSISGATASAAASIVRIDGARRSSATGIAWSSDLVITAAHVVRARDGISIAREDGQSFAATIVGGDSGTDVALLRAEGAQLKPIGWSDREPRVGHLVLVAGRPGRTLRTSLGLISAAAGEWRTHDGSRIDRYIDVDASLPRGFSGGPLLDSEGAAIGLNTSGVTRGGTTIPHATVNRVVDELQQHGSIRRPLLGVGVYPVEEGLLVMSVKDGSGAANAGIRVGDIIRTIGAEEVRSPRKLHAILMNGAVGNEIEVELLRGGEKRNVRVAVGAA